MTVPHKPLLFSCVLALCVLVSAPAAHADTLYYFLRHAEVDMGNKDKPLLAAGKARAAALVDVLKGKAITHVFATNYHRTTGTVAPLAQALGRDVVQVPKIGTKIDGKKVTNRSKGKTAIKPMVKTLKALPDGSVAVVAANSGNLFEIITALGADLPCKTRKCFPKDRFDTIWQVTVSGGAATVQTSTY